MKYKLTAETKLFFGITLYRIQRITTGELGGFIQSEANLSQDGNAWVSDNARVFGNALVFGDARVFGDAQVFGDALVSGDAQVYGNARVFGNALVTKFHHIATVTNLDFSITVTPQNIVIGCQLKTHAEWLALSIKDARALGLPKGKYYFYKRLLTLLIRAVTA